MNKAKGFRPAFIIVPIILLLTAIVVFTAVAVIRHNLRLINGSPYDFAESYLQEIKKDELITLALDYVGKNITSYESLDAASAQLSNKLKNASLTISRADSYSNDSPVFTIYADGEEAFTLSLKSASKISLKKIWKVNELKISENAVFGKPLILDVPKGASIIVNAIEIPRSASEKVPYYALSEFESSLSDEIYSERYRLGVFFTSPDIVTVLNGKRLSADTAENGVLRYAYPRSELIGVTVTVPYHSSVTVNGVSLSRSYSVDSGVKYPFLTRFEESMTGLPTSVIYQISGLFKDPEIKVIYNSTELVSPDNSHTYALPDALTQKAVILAPSYATVKINGYTVSNAEITRNNVEHPLLEPEKTYAKKRPYMTEYTVNGLLSEPVITAYDESGSPLDISTYYSTPDVVFFSCVKSNNMPDREKLTLRTFGREYVEYFYNGKNNLDYNYKDITAMTPSGSSAYYALHAAYSAVRKAPAYKNIKVGTISFLEYYSYSTTSYSVIMEVPFTATLDGVNYSFTVTLDVLYIYSGEIRRVVGYQVLDTVSKIN